MMSEVVELNQPGADVAAKPEVCSGPQHAGRRGCSNGQAAAVEG